MIDFMTKIFWSQGDSYCKNKPYASIPLVDVFRSWCSKGIESISRCNVINFKNFINSRSY